jgi:hypothetical protein
MSGPTSPPGKISPANAPPCSSTKSLWLQTTMGEGGIKGGAMGEGGIEGGAVDCPNRIPQNIQAAANPATVMSRGPRGELAMPKGRTKATMPTLHASIAKGSHRTIAEIEGGGNMTRDDGGQRRTTTMDDEPRQQIYLTIN